MELNYKNLKFFSLIFYFLFHQNVYSGAYSSFSPSYLHSESASIMSMGVAINSISSLYSNPSLLLSSNRNLVDLSLALPFSESKSGALLPTSAGFFVNYENQWGYGVRVKQSLYKNFPFEDKNYTYTSSVFISYALMPKLKISGGVGPSSLFRNNVQSNYSWTYFSSISFEHERHHLGLSLESFGSFKLEGYRGSDSLKERLPELLLFGYLYKLSTNYTFYGEARRLFYERSVFDLNGENAKPKLDRGLGAELQLSGGILTNLNEKWSLRTGMEYSGIYDSNGKNLKSIGLGLGFSYKIFEEEEESYRLHFSIQRIGLYSKSGGRNPETMLYLSASSLIY